MQKGLWQSALPAIAVILGLWIGIELFARITTESLWFAEVGYSDVFWLRIGTRFALLLLGLLMTGGFLGANLLLASRLKYGKLGLLSRSFPQQPQGQDRWKRQISYPIPNPPFPTPNPATAVRLETLLALLALLGLLVGAIVIYYGQVAAEYWQPNSWMLVDSPSIPVGFGIKSGEEVFQQASASWWQMGLLLLLTVVVMIEPRVLYAIAALLSLGFGSILSGQWAKVLVFFHPSAFNLTDPVFHRDIGFYIFTFPLWELLEFWLIGVLLFALCASGIVYLVSGNSISEGRFPGFSEAQLRHLHGLGAATMLAIALRYWLLRYQLLYSAAGVTYGASYTEANVELWMDTSLSFLAAAIALFLLFQLRGGKREPQELGRVLQTLAVYVSLVAIGGYLIPGAVQRFIVQPNELERERPYIERSIAFTRQAFDLARIDVRIFNPQDTLTYEDILENDLTIRNIRLWDSRPLLQTNRQLQQIRLYYKFPDADIDRYTLKKADPEPNEPPTERQQVILAARELDYSSVPAEAQTWINQHLVYTHGYGFTLSPVNTVGPGGLPDYFVRDIGIDPSSVIESTLRTTEDRIRASIPIGHPRLYYGEITDTYVMAPSKVKELDYPSGDENVYNTYDGKGGIPIGAWWRRLSFAKYLNNWQMLFTDNFTRDTKLLFRRDIKQRIQAIAPFLKFDSDPYLVVANTRLYNPGVSPSTQSSSDDTFLYWIVDAYTTSDRYPYSEPGPDKFNYIRNSVKVVVDAYNGDVNFYIADPSDPIINTWNAIFPNLFQPIDTMPVTLRSHIRYPVDFFNIQSERLLTYHMTDTQVFYNREDQWRVPNEIYASERQPVEPYYLIMKLPTETSEEFILLHPFTPKSRNNLIAWLAGRSDGIHYGKLLLYQFPKQELVYGPEQIEARINQDPIISQQISLWNRQGSRAIQGNLLVIPIEQSLLYVEPLYIEAEENSLPILARVIVAYENQIVMAETLNMALKAIFQQEARENTTSPTIIRPLEQPSIPLDEPLLDFQ